MIKGIVMSTKELKELVVYFKDQGIYPTVKEFCTKNTYINQYHNRKAS
jgi:hypothetical protein